MGLMSKLKEILFDEETVEIPVITKEDKKENKKTPSVNRENKVTSRKTEDDEVIIKKIETPKRETPIITDDVTFEMPKFKEDKKEEETPKREKINTFTFPVFDEEEVKPTRSEQKPKDKPQTSTSKNASEKPSNRASGYTNAYDYSYGKYKGDYMANRENNHEVVTKTLEEKEEKRAFTPSPIISPVYGVLNENYKKEDIISKSEKKAPIGHLDLDSVRRKAYGTLEDEIEASLSGRQIAKSESSDIEREIIREDESDEGISIDDLLAGETIEGTREEFAEETQEYDETDAKIDNLIEEVLDAGSLEDSKNTEPVELRKPELDEPVSGPRIPDEAEEVKMEKTENKDNGIGEEDLFDLIDSLYEGKGDE
ncbi:MAG TPA: hypothetical protein DCY94_01805 [Firmicutes bacterium]|nr:hypothetical protein [Bacillota bacterium]